MVLRLRIIYSTCIRKKKGITYIKSRHRFYYTVFNAKVYLVSNYIHIPFCNFYFCFTLKSDYPTSTHIQLNSLSPASFQRSASGVHLSNRISTFPERNFPIFLNLSRYISRSCWVILFSLPNFIVSLFPVIFYSFYSKRSDNMVAIARPIFYT